MSETTLRPHAWGRSYENHQRMKIEQLRAARARGETFFRFGVSGRVVDPSRMTDSAIERAAMRDAERVVNRAIIEYNEQAERERLAS